MVLAETVLLTVQGEPRGLKSSIDSWGDRFGCSCFPLSPWGICAAPWDSKLLQHLDLYWAALHGILLLLEARLLLVSQRAEPFVLGWIPPTVVQSPHKAAVNWPSVLRKTQPTYQPTKPTSNKLDFCIHQFGTSAQLLNKYSRQTFCRAEQQGPQFLSTPVNPSLRLCEPSSSHFPLQISLLSGNKQKQHALRSVVRLPKACNATQFPSPSFPSSTQKELMRRSLTKA